LNRKARAEPFFSEPLPDAPWPVEARNLLTDREQSFYQRLLNVYPHHKILVQVALSQLIEVDRNHPERQSIRARYKQLVADFVLCRPDLSIVAVIELDDLSHESAVRQGADARKNKALADAGIKLVRIPAGSLPSENALRGLIGAEGAVRPVAQEETELRLAETVETFSVDDPAPRPRNEARGSRMLRSLLLKAALGGVFLGGWFIYMQFLPRVVQRALQPLAAPRVATPSVVPPAAAAMGPSAEVVAMRKRSEIVFAAALQKQKILAWGAFYSAPASCEHPVDWNAQVECGNQYMRAKKRFEAQWAAEHASGHATSAAGMLDNRSVGGSPK
jgi:very-short-patch-repair endonuclease